ncbi:hypothetical protein DH2020_002043 [Rehmannia glutinosa]|uniref:Reverse transcriptase domain-containing protein n=1 Tax=Rehmannia glutinosa TaxID=99300 RepID=A0ABR0XSM5_REHGL
MNLLSWNCRGLGNPRTVQELRDFIRVLSPGLVFLCETKFSSRELDNLKNSLGFFGVSVPSVGRSGGLALLWRPNVNVSLRGFHERFIDVHVTLGQNKFRFTGVYGQPLVSQRRVFWDTFKSLFPPTNEPWICMGDFNEVLQQHEFSGIHHRAPWQISLFRDAIHFCDLSDMGFCGPRFTWKCLLVHSYTQRGHLDRSLCNPDFRTIFPRHKVTNIPSFTSDHALICTHIDPLPPRSHHHSRRKLIRFESFWIRSSECKRIIKEAWSFSPGALNDKLNHCLADLHYWSRSNFGDLSDKIKQLKSEISKLEKGLISPKTKQQLIELHGKLDILLELNDMKWKQRAKQHWYKNGDRNTSFFHAHASKRRDINHISSLTDKSGQSVSDPAAIERIIAINRIRPRILEEMADCLTCPYSNAEVIKAVKHMHPFKSPGPDGMSPIFFQKYWSIVGNDVTNSVLNFLNNKQLFPDMNDTHIVLLPKIKNPTLVSQFRPISLCNVAYRIASKVISNCMFPILSKIISETQSSFLPGRLISDNILVAYEIYYFMKGRTSGKLGLMSIKLDMSKAFDRIEWPFALAVMHSMGFPASFIGLIRLCLSTPSFSFLLNGSQFGRVLPKRGIRQADPISPYIFIICAEVFSSILQDLQEVGKIHGVKINKHAPSVSHLFFVDDTLLYGHASIEEAKQIKFAITLFEQASGQRINFEKSGVLFSPNMDQSTAQQIAHILGIPIVASHGKYLGLPSVIGKNKQEVFSNIQDRVWKRIQGWKEKTLSQAGREILIKAVIQSIPTYAMSCFRLPDTILHKIQLMAAQYFWGGSSNERKLHWLSWNKIARSKENGGLGFRHLRAFNLALLAKQAWRLLTQPSTLLSRILQAKYYPNGNFFDAGLGSRPSWSWRSILESRSSILLVARRLIRSGTKTRIWSDLGFLVAQIFFPILLQMSMIPTLQSAPL